MAIREKVFALSVVVGGGIAKLCGGWDSSMTTLVAFMVTDYITGVIVASVFKKSGKSENGALESRAGLKGLLRKGAALLMVLIAARLDILLGYDSMIRNAVIIGLIVNELISLVENFGLMGVPFPGAVMKAIDVLKAEANTKGDRK